MKDIAEKTGGQYFRATDNQKLEKIYEEINKLEKTDIEEIKYMDYNEMFRPWVILALVLLGFEFLLRITVFRGFL